MTLLWLILLQDARFTFASVGCQFAANANLSDYVSEGEIRSTVENIDQVQPHLRLRDERKISAYHATFHESPLQLTFSTVGRRIITEMQSALASPKLNLFHEYKSFLTGCCYCYFGHTWAGNEWDSLLSLTPNRNK